MTLVPERTQPAILMIQNPGSCGLADTEVAVASNSRYPWDRRVSRSQLR